MTSNNSQSADGRPMQYRNTEMKIDQLIGYLNDGKINLSPAFQRGHVWKLETRRKLIANIVQGRPIPAIFLYKDAQGSRYSYNILDGKQRIESLILFIADRRTDLRISLWKDYFFPAQLRTGSSFTVELPNGKKTFAQLDESTVRDFREYAIPTIEISMSDETTLDEIINLFVDINQQGEPVKRFSIVKAMGTEDALLQSLYDLVAITQTRGLDEYYRVKANEFTSVLKRISLVAATKDNNAQVDRMWERLMEIALFWRTKMHRKPVEVLKGFIRARARRDDSDPALSSAETKGLRKIFKYLRKAYRNTELSGLPLATDYTHFYAMMTGIIAGGLLDKYAEGDLTKKLIALGRMIDGTSRKPSDRKLAGTFAKYMELSAKRTTEASRRQERQQHFLDLIDAL